MEHTPSPLPEFAFTGRKLGRAVLAYVGAVIAVITLTPFTFVRPAHVTIMLWDNAFDPIANVVLFLPVGFLFALARSAMGRDDARALLLRATALGLAASSTIEIVQIFEPTRFPSPTDVASNTIGAALGAWAYLRAAKRLSADAPIVGRLALEVPLMGLVYLLVPLLALAALTVRGAPGVAGAPGLVPRGWALVALGLFGGTLLGHVYRRQLTAGRAARPRTAIALGAGWFAVGALPALATAPRAFVAGIVAAAGVAWLHGTTSDGASPINRRFEPEALRRAAPWLVAYLVLLALTDAGTAPDAFGKLDILRVVETLAAFSVLGYVLAEAWGRLELRYRFTVWRVGLVGLGAAIAEESIRRMAAPSIGAVPTVVAGVIAAAYGGWMYHLQRAHVRALVAARAERRVERSPGADAATAPEHARRIA